jgi:ribosomal-protein-alanine N-acetyltransferase
MIELERHAAAAAHWPRSQYLAIFQPGAASRLCLVSGSGDVQAFLVARTAGPDWELENIVVAPAARRRGLGKRLLETLLQHAQRHSAQAVWLEVRASNAAARALYESCGFAPVGVRRLYYRDPQENAILFSRNLKDNT